MKINLVQTVSKTIHIRFQIINLLFLSLNSATFDAKVTEFLGTNK